MANQTVQNLLAELATATDPAEKAAIVAESVISDLPETVALVARRCVILHWFDEAIVAALTPEGSEEMSAEVYQQLAELTFIEIVPQGLAYHDLTRDGLVKLYSEMQPDLLKEGARLAAPIYENRGVNEQYITEAFFCYTVAGKSSKSFELLFETLFRRARKYQKWQHFLVSLEMQEEAEKLSFVNLLPRNALYWIAQGIAQNEKGNFDAAIIHLNKAIELDPGVATAYNVRGVAYHNKGDLTSAITNFEKAIQFNPEGAIFYSNRSLIYTEQGNLEAAIVDCDKAIRLNPDFAFAYVNRGSICQRRGDLDAAIADFNQAIQLNPDNALAHINRGIVYRQQKNLEAAIADFDRAIQLNPDDANAYYNRGLVYYAQGNLKATIADFDKTVQLNPDFIPIYDRRAIAHQLGLDIEGIISYFETAQRLDPDNLSKMIDLAGAYIDIGQIEKGQQLAEEILSYYSLEIEYYDQARLETFIGRESVAIELLEKSIKEDLVRKEWVQKDPDFRQLWGYRRFRALVELPPLEA